MAQKVERPDGKRVRELIGAVQRVDQRFGEVVSSEPVQRKAAQTAAQALFQDRLKAALEQMDVEHINKGKQGIRVSLLREAGITNVYQVSQMSYQRLCAIEGLGDRSADKIRDTVKGIVQNTRQNLRVRIRVEDPGKVDDGLVRSLYVMIHMEPLRKAAAALYQAHHGPVQKEIPLAKEGTGAIGWVFKSKGKKEQICQAVASLEARMAGPFGDGALLGQVQKVEQADTATCWKDYISDASRYYAQLEQLGLDWKKEEGTPGGLPEQLVAEVEKQALDLAGLKATLRSYQTFGAKYIVHQKQSLLGDEMGLGKTIQAIASMVALKAEGKTHFMVVCPASVLVNWCREVAKFSEMEVTKVHGNDEEALLHWRMNGDVAVTTFESISRFTLPEKFPISMVVVDEAHYVKNPETIRTKALLKLLAKTDRALFMSGTPLENRVEEMQFLVSCLQPKLAEDVKSVMFLATAEQFRQQLAPVYLRRTRDDVLQELPELIEKEQWCTLGTKEQALYREAVLSGNFMAIRQVSWQVEDLKDSSKAMRLLELCDQAREQGRKVIVFSYFRNTIGKVLELLGDRCVEPVTGDIDPARRQEIVDEFTAAGDGAVLVSQVTAGGTGLNIQSASVIIFCEPQIKPSIENQAIARAYRMGQVRDVLVYRLLADETIDERMLQILKVKQEQFDNFADQSAVGEESLKPSEQDWIKKMVEEEKKRLMGEGEA
ncbi:MAG: DEAD/DEAH box helicase [Oscillospiraceae bacterium]|nr:DEAD/DEAH box helicase [Oscillospiraceae bacterium]